MIHEAPQPLICIINNENEDDVAVLHTALVFLFWPTMNYTTGQALGSSISNFI